MQLHYKHLHKLLQSNIFNFISFGGWKCSDTVDTPSKNMLLILDMDLITRYSVVP